jgi:hypothetical protein
MALTSPPSSAILTGPAAVPPGSGGRAAGQADGSASRRLFLRTVSHQLFQHIEREETFGPATVPTVVRDAILPGQGGESYGVALSVGQYGDGRLNGESPIDGLFYVGCDAGGFGLGTHQAVDSAVNVSRLVQAYHHRLGQG